MGAVENLAVVQLPLHVAHDALPKRSHPGQVVLVRFVMMRRICRPDRSTARFVGGLTRSDKGDSVNLGLYGVYPFVGGALRADLPARDDAALVDVLCAELRNLLGITAVPELTRVHHPPWRCRSTRSATSTAARRSRRAWRRSRRSRSRARPTAAWACRTACGAGRRMRTASSPRPAPRPGRRTRSHLSRAVASPGPARRPRASR